MTKIPQDNETSTGANAQVKGGQLGFPGQETDALRRHICQILGFDMALIDIVRGNNIDNLFTFYADEPNDELSVGSLVDRNGQPLSESNNDASQAVRKSYAPYVDRVFRSEDKDGDDVSGFPYIIVPISDGQGDTATMIKGVIRVVSFDPDRKIENTDVSNVRLIGQHLATRLPYIAATEPETVSQATAPVPDVTEPIVVAHTNRAVRRRLSRTLGSEFHCIEADDAAKVFDALKNNETIALMVLDSQLVGENGESLCKVLKSATSEHRHIPVVLVAPESDPNSRVAGLNAGADDCVSDNWIDAELLARARSSMRLRKTERELATQLKLLEDYAQRLEYSTEVERLASLKISTEKSQLDERNQKLKISKREIEILRNQDLMLRRCSDIIRGSFNIDENVGEMLESLAGWLELDCCFVTLTEECEEQDAIRQEYAEHEGYRLGDKDFDLAILDIYMETSRNQDMLLINDVKRDKRVEPFREVLSQYHLYSVFYVPITYEGKLLGLLGGHKCESQAQWTQDNETFLSQVAGQLAIGVTNARLYKRVERQAITDGLTGLFNHRTGQEKLAEQLRIAERYQRNLSVVMMDIDHFKSINDTYGHPVGDTVLKGVAQAVRGNCRDVDIPVRYGGEEFLLVLPEINLEGAVVVAERLRKHLQREVISHDEVQLSVTASIGVASYPEDAESQHQLLELADKALYMSKRMGRNQVHTAADLVFQELEAKDEHDHSHAHGAGQPIPSSSPADQPPIDDKEGLVPEVVEMVKAMAGALYAKSDYNKVHHLETARFSEMVAKVLGLNQRQVEQIRVAGLLHDVGLLSVPEEIINKPGQVTPDELRVLMQHPIMGAQMFRPIHALKEICDILENHHECWDGTGYPRGLKGEEIPLAARILAIVDAYHAMISDRPYRPAMSKDKAKRVLRNGAGTQFDPFLIDIFIAVLLESEEAGTAPQPGTLPGTSPSAQ